MNTKIIEEKSKFHIIYYRGDRNKLAVVEIVPALSYELNDYAVASKENFDSYSEAAKYARELCKKNELTFIPDSDEPDYLDG